MSKNVFAWLRAPGLPAAAGVAALLLANAASAQECADDSDCGDGYVCESQGTRPCAATPPNRTCPEGDEECLKQNALPAPECDMTEYKACAPAPCDADGDCPDSMKCIAHEEGACSTRPSIGMVCPDGQECEPPPPPPEDDCTTETVSQCTPRYLLPCEEDSDCGEGFKCKEQISVRCSGSAGTGTAGSGSSTPPGAPGEQDGGRAEPAPAPTPIEPECESEPTGEYWCELQEIPCQDDGECPSDFECADNPNRAVCSSSSEAQPGTGTAAHDAGAATPSDGQGAGGGDDPCGAVNDGVAEKVCLPPNYYAAGRGSANDLAAGTAGVPMSAGEAKNADAGAMLPGATPPSDGDSVHNSGSHDDGSTDPEAKDSGCSVAAPGATDASHAIGLLGMLGFCAIALRRRARKAA